MVKKYKIITNRLLNTMLQIEKAQRARLEELKGYEGISLKIDGIANGKLIRQNWEQFYVDNEYISI